MNDIIPGVLLLSDKIYGKYKNKTLYRCIPYDRKLYPDYLICYQVKELGFNKKEVDKYILFKRLPPLPPTPFFFGVGWLFLNSW